MAAKEGTVQFNVYIPETVNNEVREAASRYEKMKPTLAVITSAALRLWARQNDEERKKTLLDAYDEFLG